MSNVFGVADPDHCQDDAPVLKHPPILVVKLMQIDVTTAGAAATQKI